MAFIKNNKGEEPVDIFYEDYGKGQPVILIHGWPLSSKAWEQQRWKLVEEGYRCIAYDRRGFGHSSAPWNGYDYSSLASDLNEIINQLNLEDVVIVGFSMGGGEVVRYLTDYGSSKISKAALISSIIPLVKQKDDNPAGVPEEDIRGILDALQSNRVAFLNDFHKNFYNYEENKDTVKIQNLGYDFNIASSASPRATIQAAIAWADTDFRPELKNVDVPTLIVHGDADNIVPIETAGKQAAEGIANNTFKIVKDGPHGLNLTHADELNNILIDFLKS